ncbi:MAG: VOC family protein [Chloroflexi bacterium]|nr:VOC family protein [Chloroflexota bacterium]
MVTGFNHTGLVVDDIERMVSFYCDDLGLEELNRVESNAPPEGNHTGISGSRRTLVFVGFEDGHKIELVKYHEPESTDGHQEIPELGTAHICFNVDDLEKTHSELSARGVRFVTAPLFRETEGGGRHGIVYAQDPEGNWLEFIE